MSEKISVKDYIEETKTGFKLREDIVSCLEEKLGSKPVSREEILLALKSHLCCGKSVSKCVCREFRTPVQQGESISFPLSLGGNDIWQEKGIDVFREKGF